MRLRVALALAVVACASFGLIQVLSPDSDSRPGAGKPIGRDLQGGTQTLVADDQGVKGFELGAGGGTAAVAYTTGEWEFVNLESDPEPPDPDPLMVATRDDPDGDFDRAYELGEAFSFDVGVAGDGTTLVASTGADGLFVRTRPKGGDFSEPHRLSEVEWAGVQLQVGDDGSALITWGERVGPRPRDHALHAAVLGPDDDSWTVSHFPRGFGFIDIGGTDVSPNGWMTVAGFARPQGDRAYVAIRPPDGDFSEPILIPGSKGAAEQSLDAAIAFDGSVAVTMNSFETAPRSKTSFRSPGGEFSRATRVPGSTFESHIEADGPNSFLALYEAIVNYSDSDGVLARTLADGSLSAATRIFKRGVGGIFSFDTNVSGDAIVVGSDFRREITHIVATAREGGADFTAPITLGGEKCNCLLEPLTDLDSEGNAVVAWSGSRDDVTPRGLRVSWVNIRELSE